MRCIHCTSKILGHTRAFLRALLLSALLLGCQFGLLTSFIFAQGLSSSSAQSALGVYSSHDGLWDCKNKFDSKHCQSQQDNHNNQHGNPPGNIPGNAPGNAPGNVPGNIPGNTPGNVSRTPPNNPFPLLPPTGCDTSPLASPDPSISC